MDRMRSMDEWATACLFCFVVKLAAKICVIPTAKLEGSSCSWEIFVNWGPLWPSWLTKNRPPPTKTVDVEARTYQLAYYFWERNLTKITIFVILNGDVRCEYALIKFSRLTVYSIGICYYKQRSFTGWEFPEFNLLKPRQFPNSRVLCFQIS